MAGDLPPGKWSAVLVGAWWPQPPDLLRQSSQHWGSAAAEQEHFAQDLRNQSNQLSRNQGVTADDLIERFHDGEKFHLDLAEKYGAKRDAFNSGAGAMETLRSGLRGIAEEYNQKISEIEKHAGIGSSATAAVKIAALITEANSFAAHKSGTAVAALTDAVQKILKAEGVGMSPQEFLKNEGLNTDQPTPPNAEAAAKQGLGLGTQGSGSGQGDAAPPVSAGTSAMGDKGSGGSGPGIPGGAPEPQTPGTAAPAGAGVGGGFHGSGVPASVGGGGGHVPSGGVPSGLGAGGLSPAAMGQGLSPDALGKSFSSGLSAGQPAAAGAQSLTAGSMHAAAQPPAAPAAPLASVAPTVASVGTEYGPVQHASAAGGAPVVSTGGSEVSSPVAPPVVAAPVAPVGGAPAVPAGPLPAYGADIRPPLVATPAPSPVGPMAGAPVAPSPSSAPSAGGSMMSPVERTAAAAAQGQASGGAMAGAGLASASAGAAAGGAAKRLAEQASLQRKVDAVARQEPSIAWAAGLLDDGTTVLVTDLAGGWIPPHVKLPAGVSLLAPAARRRDVGVVDLLGAAVVVAAYKPNSYISEPGPDDPVLSGERARYGQHIEELGPALVDAVRRRAGLPRIAQAVAGAAVRRTGVLDSEADLIRDEAASVRRRVLSGYPEHPAAAVGDWMLLSAIEAAIGEHDELTKYHLAWFEASFATTAGRH